MNKNEKNILTYLSHVNSSTYTTIKEISKKIDIPETEVGSHCYKLRENGFLEGRKSNEDEKMTYRITTSGELHLEKEKNSKKNLLLNGLTSYGTIALAIATVALAFGTIELVQNSQEQTELFQKDFDYTNRPWIGHLTFKQIGFENSTGHFLSVDEFKKQSDEEDRLFTTTIYVHKIELTNFGKLPATDVKIKRTAVLVEDMNFEYSQFFDFVDSIEIESGAIIMPGETITLDARLPPKYIENPSVYGVKVDYNYLENKRGEFQQIFELKISPGNRSNHILVHTYTE